MRQARVGWIFAALGALGLGLWVEGCLFAPDNCTDLLACPPKGAGGETGTTTSTATTVSGSTGSKGCSGDGECDMPTNDGCTAAMCNGSFCVRKDTTGAPANTQIPNDCLRSVCGADGLPAMMIDPTDVPADDANVCTTKICVGQVPTKEPAAIGTVCPNGTCDGAGTCANCTKNADCKVGTNPTCDIALHTCISCSDGIKNGTETGLDCGGNCQGCNGRMCLSGSVCASGNCIDGRCCDTPCAGTCMVCNFGPNIGTCTNTPQGGLDSVTCADPTQSCDGAGACKKASAQSCAQNAECGSGVCLAGVCRAPNGKPCVDSAECASKRCANNNCAACALDADCPSSSCVAGVCKAPNGSPCDVAADCVGGKCQGDLCKLDNNDTCVVGLDCLSGFCSGGTCQSCMTNANCPGSSCGSAPALGINVCKLPTTAYCEPTLPSNQNCNAGVAKCSGFPASCH